MRRMRPLASLALLLLFASCATDRPTPETFPSGPLTIIAPANPGGGWDQTARLVQRAFTAEALAPVPVEVVNRPGAGGTIGLAELATRHRGNGHTILMLGRVMLGAILTNSSAVELSGTVPLARLLNEYEAITVPVDSKYQKFEELLEDFRRDPQKISWAGGSAGGTDHILVAMIAQAAGVEPSKINYIAHSGGGEAAVAVLGGHVTAGVSGFGEWKALVSSGKMRFLAVSSEKRMPGYTTPTLKESGIDIVLANWRSVAAAPGTPEAAVQWWVERLERMRATPTWTQILRDNDWEDSFLEGDAFQKFLAEETESNRAALRSIGLVQ